MRTRFRYGNCAVAVRGAGTIILIPYQAADITNTGYKTTAAAVRCRRSILLSPDQAADIIASSYLHICELYILDCCTTDIAKKTNVVFCAPAYKQTGDFIGLPIVRAGKWSRDISNLRKPCTTVYRPRNPSARSCRPPAPAHPAPPGPPAGRSRSAASRSRRPSADPPLRC